MKIAAVAMARNEADIIEAYVRSNLAIVDVLYLALHLPEDGTREIVHHLAAEGLAIRLFEDTNPGYHQMERVNALTRLAFSEGADFVVPLDADEILHVADRATLEAAFAALPEGRAGALRWLTYVGTSGDDVHELRAPQRMTHRVDVGPPWTQALPQSIDAEYGKVVVGRWFAARPDAAIYWGSHAVLVGQAVAMVACPGVEVAHFPVRSLKQLTRKVVEGWQAYLARGGDAAAEGLGLHWKVLHDRYQARGALDWGDVREFVAQYLPPQYRRSPLVLDPVPGRGGALRYYGLRRPMPEGKVK